MSLQFTKMHGLGNDFIVIDATTEQPILSPPLIQELSDRHTGIGFDQLLVIEPAQDQQADFTYRIFNADGQEVEQCGNGARCVAHYLFTEKLPERKHIKLATLSGRIDLIREENNLITANMGRPQLLPETIPFITEKEAIVYELQLADSKIHFGAVSMGNPHVVLTVADVTKARVEQVGQLLQHHPAFPKQVNVGFMEIVAPDYIKLRVYERGVGETRACGSGACAAVVIGRLNQRLSTVVTVELLGGNLVVNWPSSTAEVLMTGPAVKVYKGELCL